MRSGALGELLAGPECRFSKCYLSMIHKDLIRNVPRKAEYKLPPIYIIRKLGEKIFF
jgi:hypothetical protein